jgi:hypothetical protein
MINMPPLVADIADGKVTWKRLEGLDHETLGYFLLCHLIIEHYIDEYLKASHPEFDWDAARNSFAQKMALMGNFKVSDKYDCIAAIKHLNTLRNKLSHDIDFKIQPKELHPLLDYLERACDGKTIAPSDPRGIMELFTMMVCAMFAGCITSHAQATKLTRKPSAKK